MKTLPAGRATLPVSQPQAECLEVVPPDSKSLNKNVRNIQHLSSRTLLGTPREKKIMRNKCHLQELLLKLRTQKPRKTILE